MLREMCLIFSYLSDVVFFDGICVKSEFFFIVLYVELVDDVDVRSFW